MKIVFKLYSVGVAVMILSSSVTHLYAGAAFATPSMSTINSPSMSMSKGSQAAPTPAATTPVSASQPSVHEMFKDIPQDQLLQMMEEGQQFIKYLEEHGTQEEKMAFAQAMEETLQSFSEEDWAEFEAIVDTVQDKLPPMLIEPKAIPVVESVSQPAPKKEETTVVDNSLEKVLHAIHKAINTVLLKAKSDKILTERVTINWDNKDNFDEMHRLLQTLNKKEHIAKLMASKDEMITSLVESIQNFNKRLQLENDQFVIADTFGLEIDEKTTASNLKKLNKILDFFNNAIGSLLPKLIKYFEEYEPEALKISKEHDDDAKKALEHATNIEKQKKAQQHYYNDRSQYRGQRNYHQNSGYTPQASGQAAQREQTPGYLEQVHRSNIASVPKQKKSSPHDDNANTNTKEADTKKEKKEVSQFQKAVEALEDYLAANGIAEMSNYTTAMNKANGIYSSFGTPIKEADTKRFDTLKIKRSAESQDLLPEEVIFLQRYEEQWQKANENFGRNTQAAHTYYSNLSESISTIAFQIDEILQVIQILKSSLSQMSSTELEKLKVSTELKKFEKRIEQYHTTFKNVQNELKNKHRINKIHRNTPNEYTREERDYDDLAAKVESLHGLDKKIAEARSQFDYLEKSIKSSIAKRKREENKAISKK